MVPDFSPYAAAASTTSALALESVRNASIDSTLRAPAMARRARSTSGQSLIGSAPSNTNRSSLPSAAARNTLKPSS